MPEALRGRQKAAILLVSLGPELSSRIYRYLNETDIERLTLEIAALQKVPQEVRDHVMEEFHELVLGQAYLSQGGLAYARDLLERALGAQKAVEILHRLTQSLQVRPFDFLRRAEPTQVLSFIQGEHPQTIALILTYMDPEQAAQILSGLPPDRQTDVARRMALMEPTPPEVVREVERILERKLSSLVSAERTPTGGLDAVVQVLNRVDRSTERTILEQLAREEPDLAEEIKKRLFVFEDVVLLDDRALQRVLREVDLSRDLPLALKVASDEVKSKIMRNLSSRAAENLEENIQFLGPVRLRDVEEAQQKIVAVIRRLEEEGEIVIARGGGDQIVV